MRCTPQKEAVVSKSSPADPTGTCNAALYQEQEMNPSWLKRSNREYYDQFGNTRKSRYFGVGPDPNHPRLRGRPSSNARERYDPNLNSNRNSPPISRRIISGGGSGATPRFAGAGVDSAHPRLSGERSLPLSSGNTVMQGFQHIGAGSKGLRGSRYSEAEDAQDEHAQRANSMLVSKWSARCNITEHCTDISSDTPTTAAEAELEIVGPMSQPIVGTTSRTAIGNRGLQGSRYNLADNDESPPLEAAMPMSLSKYSPRCFIIEFSTHNQSAVPSSTPKGNFKIDVSSLEVERPTRKLDSESENFDNSRASTDGHIKEKHLNLNGSLKPALGNTSELILQIPKAISLEIKSFRNSQVDETEHKIEENLKTNEFNASK